jgi:pSer/pThr/pTyr-binding forkhead associated (FHA) protein
MRVYARVLVNDERVVDLAPGDLVGRLWSAKLRIDDARVSEAHAMVSLRGAQLKLLALRGVLVVNGKRVPEVRLEDGTTVHLAPDVVLEVAAVEIPPETLAVRIGEHVETLMASVYSVLATPMPRLVPRYDPSAVAHVWSTGQGWSFRVPGTEAVELAAGSTVEAGGVTLSFEGVPVRTAAAVETRGGLMPPMRIVAQYDTVHIHQRGRVVSLNGIAARIVSELVGFDGPADWEVVARQIWRDDADRFQVRRKWDVNLARLRRKLRDAGVRADLVHADGTGNFELLLYPDDVVEDRT